MTCVNCPQRRALFDDEDAAASQESAYAELFFSDILWPDFSEADLASAVQAFVARDRRYGGVPANSTEKKATTSANG